MDGNPHCFICNKLFNFVDTNCYHDQCGDSDANTLLSKNVQTFFLLRHVIGLPLDKLETYLISCNDNQPDNWIKLCDDCNQFVEKTQQIYKEMVLLTKDFGNLRNAIIQTISTTAAVDNVNYGGDHRSINSLDIARECLQFIQNQQVKCDNVTDPDVQLPIQTEEPAETADNLNLARTGDDDDLPQVVNVTITEKINPAIQEANQNKYQDEKTDNYKNYSKLNYNSTHPSLSKWKRTFQCNISNCFEAKVKTKMCAQVFSAHYHHHKDLIYKCTYCDKLFSSPNIQHWYSAHPEAAADANNPQFQIVPPTLPGVPWWCPICHSKFESDALRYAHILKDHHPNWENILRVTCDQCPGGLQNRFLNFSELQLHKGIMHGEVKKKAVSYTCMETGCGLEFMTKGSLKIHKTYSHSHPNVKEKSPPPPPPPAGPVVTCEICWKTFSKKCYLNQHIKREHDYEEEDGFEGVEFKLRCKICGKLVPKNRGKRHMLIVHNVGKGRKVKLN